MEEETRAEEARRQAKERAPQRHLELAEATEHTRRRLEAAGSEGAQRIISELEQAPDAQFLGPDKTPGDWVQAARVTRDCVIEAARRRTTITYGELKYAVYLATKKLVGYSMFPNLVMSVNRKGDGVLLSAIIVRKDTGRPGDGFAGYAKEQGFDAPLATLQHQVFDRFSG